MEQITLEGLFLAFSAGLCAGLIVFLIIDMFDDRGLVAINSGFTVALVVFIACLYIIKL